MKGQQEFERLRVSIGAHDRTIHSAIAWRQEAYRKIGIIKYVNGLPVIDPNREIDIEANARTVAEREGGDPEFAARVARLMIEHSVEVQQDEIIQLESTDAPRTLALLNMFRKVA